MTFEPYPPASAIGGDHAFFDTVAEMQSGALANGDQCHTAGYSAIGDGGGNAGGYTYHSTGQSLETEDGGFVIFGTAGDDYFTANNQTVARGRQFGAMGDAIANDTIPVTAAINSSAPVVDLTDGEYLLDEIQITKDNWTLTGNIVSNQHEIIRLAACTNVRIVNLNARMDPGYTPSPSGVSSFISIYDSFDILITGCMFDNFTHAAIHVSRTPNVNIVANTFSRSIDASAITGSGGLRCFNVTGNTFDDKGLNLSNNECINITEGSLVSEDITVSGNAFTNYRAAFQCTRIDGVGTLKNVVFSGNTLTAQETDPNVSRVAVKILLAENVIIADNVFEQNTTTAVTLGAQGVIKVTGNIMQGAVNISEPIPLLPQQVTIEGNTFSAGATSPEGEGAAVQLSSPDATVINNIWVGTAPFDAILVKNDNCTVRGNTISGATRYAINVEAGLSDCVIEDNIIADGTNITNVAFIGLGAGHVWRNNRLRSNTGTQVLLSSGYTDYEIDVQEGAEIAGIATTEYNAGSKISVLGVRYVDGSPEAVVVGSVGGVVVDKSGGAATTLYVKESGAGNTGWVAK